MELHFKNWEKVKPTFERGNIYKTILIITQNDQYKICTAMDRGDGNVGIVNDHYGCKYWAELPKTETINTID